MRRVFEPFVLWDLRINSNKNFLSRVCTLRGWNHSKGDFFLSKTFIFQDLALGTSQPPIQWVTSVFPGGTAARS